MADKVEVSIVFLLYNSLKNHFRKTLKGVLKQKTKHSYEIIAIDSGSTDGTVRFVKNLTGIRLYKIPNSEFSHGGTRQFGAKLAKGDFVVYLTQDATPRTAHWLDNLIKNFKDPEVVGVCSRTIPRRRASLLKKIEVYNDLSGRERRMVSQVKDWKKFEKLPFIKKREKYYFFHDISSAVRRSFVLKNPYKTVYFGEDVEFAVSALKKGKKIVFDPSSIVRHSHKYSIRETYHRNYIDAKYHKEYHDRVSVPSPRSIYENAFGQVRRDFRDLGKIKGSFSDKTFSLLFSPVIHFVEQLGQYKGGKD